VSILCVFPGRAFGYRGRCGLVFFWVFRIEAQAMRLGVCGTASLLESHGFFVHIWRRGRGFPPVLSGVLAVQPPVSCLRKQGMRYVGATRTVIEVNECKIRSGSEPFWVTLLAEASVTEMVLPRY